MLYIDMRSFRAGRKAVKSTIVFHDLWCLQATINSVFGPMDRSLNTRTSPLTWIDFAKIVFAVCLYEEAHNLFNQNLQTLRLTLAMWKGTKKNDEDSTILFWERGSIDMAGLMSANHHLRWCILSFCFHPAIFMCFSRFVSPRRYLACTCVSGMTINEFGFLWWSHSQGMTFAIWGLL